MEKAGLRRQRKEKFRRQMRSLLIILLVFTIISAIALLWNLYRIRNSQTGSGNTLQTSGVSSEYSNKYYSIGNHPTDIDKTYFKELNKAVEADDKALISEDIVKCFVSEYYTWTNKDGTYDIGGMQYIYTDRQSDFEKYTRDEVFADMDLYLNKYGRDRLMQVKEVTTENAVNAGKFTVKNASATASTADPYATEVPDSTASADEATYDAYTVQASWTYDEDTDMDLSQAQKNAVFTVIDHDGRMEIAAIQ